MFEKIKSVSTQLFRRQPPASNEPGKSPVDPATRPTLSPTFANNQFGDASIQATFGALADLSNLAGSSRIADEYNGMASEFAKWCSDGGRITSNARKGEFVADKLRNLQSKEALWAVQSTGSKSESVQLLRDLNKELKRYFVSHSAPGVIDEFADKWATELTARVQGFGTMRPGTETTRTTGIGTTAGAGPRAGIKTTLAGRFGFKHKSTTYVDDDGDINIMQERRGEAGLFAKLGASPGPNGVLDTGAYHARGKYYESDNLKDDVKIAITDRINSQMFSAHKTSGAAKDIRESFGRLKNGLAHAFGVETDFLKDWEAPLNLTAEKLAKGAMNERKIQNLAAKIASGSPERQAVPAVQDIGQLYPSYFQKIAHNATFLTNASVPHEKGVLSSLPTSAPAQTAAGNPLKPGWVSSASGGSITARISVGPQWHADAGCSLEVARKDLPLERLKKSHEFLSWAYAGSKDTVTNQLNAISEHSSSNDFFDSHLQVIDEASQPSAHRLSSIAFTDYEARLTKAATPAALEGELSRIADAMDSLSRDYHHFHELQDDFHGATDQQQATKALEQIDRMLFGGQHRSTSSDNSYADGRKLLARADDAFSVTLAAIGHRLSTLKEAVSKMAAKQTDRGGQLSDEMKSLIKRCGEVSGTYGTAAAHLKDAPTILEPDHLLRFTSTAAQGVSSKLIVTAQANAQFRIEPLAYAKFDLPVHAPSSTAGPIPIPTPKSVKVTDFLPNDVGGIGAKLSFTGTKSDHPNPFRAGNFIDISLELSHSTLLQLRDVDVAALWIKKLWKKTVGKSDHGLTDEQYLRMARDVMEVKNERLSRLSGTSGIQFSWRWRKLNDEFSGVETDRQLQRFRVNNAVIETHLSAKVPVGTFVAASTGVPLELTPELRHDTRKVQPDRETIGPDIGYQLIRYKRPQYFDPKQGFTDIAALKAQLNADRRALLQLTDYMADPGTVLGTVAQFLKVKDSVGNKSEPSDKVTDLDVFSHANYRKIVSEAVHAKALDAAAPAVPTTNQLASPYDIPRLVSPDEFKQLIDEDFESKLRGQPSRQQRLDMYLDDPRYRKVLEQFLSILQHYNDVGDVLKRTRSYQLQPRPEPGAMNSLASNPVSTITSAVKRASRGAPKDHSSANQSIPASRKRKQVTATHLDTRESALRVTTAPKPLGQPSQDFDHRFEIWAAGGQQSEALGRPGDGGERHALTQPELNDSIKSAVDNVLKDSLTPNPDLALVRTGPRQSTMADPPTAKTVESPLGPKKKVRFNNPPSTAA